MNIALIFITELTDLIAYNNSLNAVLDLALDVIQPACMAGVGFTSLLWIAFGLAHKFMNFGPETEYGDVVYRPLITIIALSVYRELVVLLINTPANYLYKIALSTPVTGGFCEFPLGNIPSTYFGNVAVQFLVVIHTFTTILAQIAGIYVVLRSFIALSAFYIMGPFAFVSSMVTRNTQILRRWYFYMMNYKMWPVVVVMILTVHDAMLVFAEPEVENPVLGSIFSLVLRFILVATIIDVPHFASHIVTSASGFMSVEADDWFLGTMSWIQESPLRVLMNRLTGGLYGKAVKKSQGKI